MAVLILSNENLRLLKHILMTDFNIRSGHASEAIAALSGYKSNAAMKTDLKNSHHSPAAKLSFEEFENRLQKLGYDDSFGLDYLRVTYTSIAFPDRPWKTFKRTEQLHRDAWFYECERLSIPFITINRKNKYCTLEWDCISIDPAHDHHLRDNTADELIRIMYRYYQLECGGNEPKSFFYGSAFVGNIKNLSEPCSRRIANTLFLWLTPWKTRLHEPCSSATTRTAG